MEFSQPLWMDCVCCAKEGANHNSAMAIVSSDHGVGDDPVVKGVVIFPREVESSREGLVDIAGRTEDLSNDDIVRTGSPSLGSL